MLTAWQASEPWEGGFGGGSYRHHHHAFPAPSAGPWTIIDSWCSRGLLANLPPLLRRPVCDGGRLLASCPPICRAESPLIYLPVITLDMNDRNGW